MARGRNNPVPALPSTPAAEGAVDDDGAADVPGLDLDAGDPPRLPSVPADGTERDPLHDLPPAVVAGTPVKGSDGLNRTAFDRAASTGQAVPALDPLGIESLPRWRVSMPADATLSPREIRAATRGDAEVAFREANGIIVAGHPLQVVGPL